MNTFATHICEDRRLRILHILGAVPGYQLNDAVICDELGALGHAATRDQVRTDIGWLAEQGLVTVERLVKTVAVATITERGLDVATGRAHTNGVKRPGPSDRP